MLYVNTNIDTFNCGKTMIYLLFFFFLNSFVTRDPEVRRVHMKLLPRYEEKTGNRGKRRHWRINVNVLTAKIRTLNNWWALNGQKCKSTTCI